MVEEVLGHASESDPRLGLLEDLRGGRIESARRKLEAQLNLEAQGYKFHYFIDTYDLEEYCLPLKLGSQRIGPMGYDEKEAREGLIHRFGLRATQEAQSTYMLLLSTPSRRLFLLDEYSGEYSRFQDFLHSLRRQGFTSIRVVEDLLRAMDEPGAEGNAHVLEELGKQTPYLLMMANSVLKIGAERLEYLLKDKLVVRIDDKVFDELGDIRSIIETCSPSSRATDLRERAGRRINIQNIRARMNLAVDCKAADLVINFNAALARERPDLKIRFLILSSTPSKSEVLEDKAIEIYKLTPETNPFRRVSELLLERMIRDGSTERTSKQAKKIALRQSDDDLEQLSRSMGSMDFNIAVNASLADSDKQVRSWLNECRADFVGHALLEHVNTIQEKINGAIKMLKAGPIGTDVSSAKKELIEQLSELLKQARARDFGNRYRAKFNEFIFDSNYVTMLASAVHRLVSGNVVLKSTTGPKDGIMGVWHRLPILFMFKEQRIRSLIERITDLYTKPGSGRIDSDNLLSRLRDFLEYIFADGDGDHHQEILRILVLFLFPHEEEWEEVEHKIYDRLKVLIKASKTKNVEYLYLACWVARRLGEDELSIGWANDGLKVAPKDPRFYHGRCVARWAKHMRQPSVRKSLKPCIDDGRMALVLYKELEIEQVRTSEVQKQIAQCRASIWNTLACALAEMAKGEGAQKELAEAWRYVGELKAQLGKDAFEQYPEFMHTNAVVLHMIATTTIRRGLLKGRDPLEDLKEAKRLCEICRKRAEERDELEERYMKLIMETEIKVARGMEIAQRGKRMSRK